MSIILIEPAKVFYEIITSVIIVIATTPALPIIIALIGVDPAEGIEAIRQVALGTFPGTVIISPKEQALEEANTPRNG